MFSMIAHDAMLTMIPWYFDWSPNAIKHEMNIDWFSNLHLHLPWHRFVHFAVLYVVEKFIKSVSESHWLSLRTWSVEQTHCDCISILFSLGMRINFSANLSPLKLSFGFDFYHPFFGSILQFSQRTCMFTFNTLFMICFFFSNLIYWMTDAN